MSSTSWWTTQLRPAALSSAAAIKVDSERPVLVLNVEDRPGEFGKVCRRIAGKGVNIELAYLATRTRLVLGVDDMEKARTAM